MKGSLTVWPDPASQWPELGSFRALGKTLSGQIAGFTNSWAFLSERPLVVNTGLVFPPAHAIITNEYIPKIWSTTSEGSLERWQRCVWRILPQLHHWLVGPRLPSSRDFAWRRVCQSSARTGGAGSRVERHHARCVTNCSLMIKVPHFPTQPFGW